MAAGLMEEHRNEVVRLRADDGRLLPLEPSRWHGSATLDERPVWRW